MNRKVEIDVAEKSHRDPRDTRNLKEEDPQNRRPPHGGVPGRHRRPSRGSKETPCPRANEDAPTDKLAKGVHAGAPTKGRPEAEGERDAAMKTVPRTEASVGGGTMRGRKQGQ